MLKFKINIHLIMVVADIQIKENNSHNHKDNHKHLCSNI
jgi:hypothetical protein